MNARRPRPVRRVAGYCGLIALLAVPRLLLGQDAPSVARYPDAVEVFHCAFDEAADPNFDGWPGGWTRQRGPGYPHYVQIGIASDPSPDGSPCLRVDLNGGSAAVHSPPIAIEPQSSYVVEVQMQTEELVHDQAYCSLTWLDETEKPLGEEQSVPLGQTKGWQSVRLGPLSPPNRRARFALIGLCVQPFDGQDLRGAVRFDDVWMARLPRIDVSSGRPQNVFTNPREIELTCRVSGVGQSVSQVQFELFGIDDSLLGQASYSLSEGGQGETTRGQIRETRAGDERTISWLPELTENGFYRVQVRLGSNEATVHQRSLSLVVVESRRAAIGGEFGWSLPHGPQPLGWEELVPLLGHAGISWTKIPVWLPDDQIDRLSWFTDRLSALGIQSIGILGDPPPAVRQRMQLTRSTSAADLFTPAPEVDSGSGNDESLVNWFALLEPTLVRLSLRIRWWQLGFDEDVSFFGYPNLPLKIAQIKEAFDQIGQDSNLGFGWSWLYEPPESQSPPWRFLSMSAEPPLTPDELAHYLRESAHSGAERWVVTAALDPDQYALADRAADLAKRIVAAKAHGAEKIFLPDPFDPQRGVMQADGSPGELFLPWRTMALTLAGASYLGQLTLPSGAENHIFSRDGETVMVAWHHQPVEETLSLTQGASRVDLWGRRQPIEQRAGGAVVAIDTVPVIIEGLDEAIARFQLGLSLDKQQLLNIPDLPQRVQLSLTGALEQGASGRVRVSTPEGWRVRPAAIDLSLSGSESIQRPIDVVLGFDAETGPKLLRFDFDLTADRRYQFTAYRWLEVGLGDVSIELTTRINEFGELEVEQRLNNQGTSDVSYNCDLFVPDRRRQRVQIIRQPPGQSTRVFRIRDGQALLGETLVLRAQELNGRRVLNYRIEAKP